MTAFFTVCYLVFGLVAVFFSKRIGRYTAAFYLRTQHIRASERIYQVAFLLAGMFFVVVALLSLFNIVKL